MTLFINDLNANFSDSEKALLANCANNFGEDIPGAPAGAYIEPGSIQYLAVDFTIIALTKAIAWEPLPARASVMAMRCLDEIKNCKRNIRPDNLVSLEIGL